MVDDLNYFSVSELKKIYVNKKQNIIVFVNSEYDEEYFNKSVVEKISSLFKHTTKEIYTTVIYFDKNYKNKNALPKISEYCEMKNSELLVKTNSIRYIGQTGTSGYACAAKSYIANYVLNGIDISWTPIVLDNSQNDKQYYVDILAESAINKFLLNIDTTIIHSTPELWKSFNVKNYIGCCAWETDKLPNSWIDYINLANEVWVPSYFNKKSFIDSKITIPIKVVPHIWHHQKKYEKENIQIKDCFGNIIPSNKYTYYCISELNFRKGIEDLISAFHIVNEHIHNTQLVLKLHYKFYNYENYKYCIEYVKNLTNKLGISIFIIIKNLNQKEILTLHSFGDCYVSLNKGEGFGLTIFDAFKLKNPVVTTGYGGQVEYLGKDYPGLVDFKLDYIKNMHSFSSLYTEDQSWAYPNIEHAVELMKQQYYKSCMIK